MIRQKSDKGPEFIAKSGNTQVPVYRVTKGWIVAWRDGGKRQRKSFVRFEKAKEHAELTAKQLSKLGDSARLISGDERLQYIRACQLLAQFGVTLDSAVADYVEARKILGKIPLLHAVREYMKNAPEVLDAPPVSSVVTEFLKAKQLAGRSERHMKDLRSRLGRFAKAFHCSIAEVKPKDVELWIESLKPTGKESLKLGQRTRVNFLGAVSNLITFSERRRYIGKGSVDLSTIERGKSVGDVEIYTPEELRAILSNARPEITPFIVIGAFAGVRTQEILRLEWGDVTDTHITIRAANAKTRSRRIVPVLPNLSAWLALYRKTEGKVCELLKPSTSLSAASEKSGIKWRPNALRHSFGSYRLALVKSESQVSLEMGNTPTMVFRHYRALVTEEKALEWFAVSAP